MAKHVFAVYLTEDQIAKLREKAQAAGILHTGSGELPPYHGVNLSYGIDGDEVTFTVESKPWWLPDHVIEDQVHEFVDAAVVNTHPAPGDIISSEGAAPEPAENEEQKAPEPEVVEPEAPEVEEQPEPAENE